MEAGCVLLGLSYKQNVKNIQKSHAIKASQETKGQDHSALARD
jgi:UDP-N-acetyl-D-mannosaminuronate dehydrogenase